MAEGDGYIYHNFKEQILNGIYNLANGQDTVKIALVGSGYTPDLSTDTVWGDVSASECAGTGYSAGGGTLVSQATSQEATFGKFDADDYLWTSLGPLTPQPAYAVLVDITATSSLMAYWEVTTATNGGNYTISWGTDGLIKLT